MGLNLNSLVGKTAEVTVHFMGETAVVSYDPLYMTQKNIIKAQDGDDESFITFCANMFKGWDVTLDNDVLPITTEGLAQVPIILIRAIFMEIMGAAGNGEVGKISSDGSQPAAKLENAQTGTSTSEPQNTWG